ncbi:hypothetical protein H6P81_006664 [Aristolochia fimbriata]|uniref:At3g05675-like ankyrin-like domain-containing protein n=1 Tax=Aristolochia fimbriata TaxID=158543 RepID=A0AAV7F039_ARIFI|nr:hypothetical protein H6P81_006664 [Aristolochia fimbriata]
MELVTSTVLLEDSKWKQQDDTYSSLLFCLSLSVSFHFFGGFLDQNWSSGTAPMAAHKGTERLRQAGNRGNAQTRIHSRLGHGALTRYALQARPLPGVVLAFQEPPFPATVFPQENPIAHSTGDDGTGVLVGGKGREDSGPGADSRPRRQAHHQFKRWVQGDYGRAPGCVGGEERVFAEKLNHSGAHLVEICECDDVEVYVEAVVLMYCENLRKRLVKEEVEKVLGLLQVSAAIKFEAGIVSCLEYLEAVPWSKEEEEKVVSVLEQLQLCDPIQGVLQRVLVEPSTSVGADDIFLHLLTEGPHNVHSVGQHDVSRGTLYSACHKCLSALHLCLSEAVGIDASGRDPWSLMAEVAREADNMLGQILVPKDTRFSLLQTWLEPLYEDFGWMKRACRSFDKKLIEDGLSQTILTLSMSQQQAILLNWFDRFLNKGDDYPNMQRAFEVWWRRAFIKQHVGEQTQSEMQITWNVDTNRVCHAKMKHILCLKIAEGNTSPSSYILFKRSHKSFWERRLEVTNLLGEKIGGHKSCVREVWRRHISWERSLDHIICQLQWLFLEWPTAIINASSKKYALLRLSSYCRLQLDATVLVSMRMLLKAVSSSLAFDRAIHCMVL